MRIRFHSSIFRKCWSKNFSFIGYGIGEYLIHKINMYAYLYGTKVLLGGKKTSLDKIFKVTKSEGNAELEIKPDATYLDGTPITIENLTQGKACAKSIIK
jgi:hypothetical protein